MHGNTYRHEPLDDQRVGHLMFSVIGRSEDGRPIQRVTCDRCGKEMTALSDTQKLKTVGKWRHDCKEEDDE